MNVCFQTVTVLMLQSNIYTAIEASHGKPSHLTLGGLKLCRIVLD